MSILTQPISYANGIGIDAAAALRTSQEERLFDGKIINQDDPYLFNIKGTGTGAFLNNTYPMSVTPGQYLVRQGKIYTNYSSGKSHKMEFTWKQFQTESGVTKEIGYLSSSNVAPYNSNLDGLRIYDDGSTKRLQSWNYGVLTSDIPMAQWDNQAAIASYDWSNFGIGLFDFLWLGGKGYRFFLKTDNGFELIHEYKHAGHSSSLIFRSPNQPLRYAIRSSSGSGSFTYVCAHISTEGSTINSGKCGSVNGPHTPIVLTTIGVTYPILGIRKKATMRDIAIKVHDFALLVNSNDELICTVQKAPTLSAPLTYNDWPNSPLQYANGNGTTITVTNPGYILLALPISQGDMIPSNMLELDLYSYLGTDIDDKMEEIVICGTPITASVNSFCSIIYLGF